MRSVFLLFVYHDLTIPSNPVLGVLAGGADPERITRLYHEIVDVPLGLPVRQRNSNRVVGSRGRVYSPHYNTYYYYYRTLFDDGLRLRRVIVYPPWRHSEIAERVIFARQRIRYFHEEIRPRIEKWLDECFDEGLLARKQYSAIRSHIVVLPSEITYDDLVELIDDYIGNNYSAFLAAERYGVRSKPVERVMRVFDLGFSDVATMFAPQIASAIIGSVSLHLGFKNGVRENTL